MNARHALLCFALLAAAPAARAQAPPAPPEARPLRLYLDCSSETCDFDFLKRELPFVDWVADRADADVRVLVTTRGTNGGSHEATLYVMHATGGAPDDTLRAFSPPAASPDAMRQLIARLLGAALAPELAVRPGGERLRVTMAPAGEAAAPAAAARDPWNHWVIKLNSNGYTNGEKTYRYRYLYDSVTGSRVTDSRKLGVSVGQSYTENWYGFDDGSHFMSVQRNWNGRALWVESLGPRWSAGAAANVYSSSYSNVNWSAGLGPALEYDLWPYAESSRRALTVGYQLYLKRAQYLELTLYGKTAETLVLHELDATLSQRQPWGSLDFGLSSTQYLHDASKYRLNLSTNADLHLVRGLSLTGYAYVTRIHDLLSLRRGNSTPEEVIARQHQLDTSYQYYASFGLTYRFGSIFDSVVNQRLENTLGSL